MSSIFGQKNVVTFCHQHFLDQLAIGSFVFRNQYRFRTSDRIDGRGGLLCADRFHEGGYVDFEGRALSRFTVDRDRTATLLYEAVDGREAQARAARFGGEERFENSRLCFHIHSHSVSLTTIWTKGPAETAG